MEKKYQIELTQKQGQWLVDSTTNLNALNDLKKRGLIKEINDQVYLELISALMSMITKNMNECNSH
jgi:hypothetical protein